MPNMTVTSGAVYIPEVWDTSVEDFRESNLVLANLVKRKDDQVSKFGDIIHIQFNTELVANNKVKGVSVSPQAPTDTQVDLTVDQHKESSFEVEDILEAQANISIIEEYTQPAGYAIAKAVDTSLAALASGFSQTKGTFNTALTTDVFLDSVQLLDDADAPQTDRHFVFRPDTKRALLDISTYTSSDFVSGRPVEGGKVSGMLYGVATHMSTNVLKSGTSTSNMLFHRDALVLAMQKGIRTQSDYILPDLATLVVADSIYGVIELRDDHGVLVKT